jgi:hypothetical protein
MKQKYYFFLLVSLLSACATNEIIVNPADPISQQAAQSFQSNPGQARVYFVGGKTGSGLQLKADMIGGAFFIIDGNKVGQINKNDVMVLDVLPKQYSFSWQYPPADSKTNFLIKNLNAGDVLILQANWEPGSLPLIDLISVPGGYMIKEIYDRGILSGKRFVKPTTCPSAICP